MKRFFLMLLASCALSVFAETAIVNDITWSYQVSGEGTATLGVGTSPVTGALVIPAEIAGYVVTAIGDEAFYNCTGLTSVTIPSSVTAIGFSAFGACSQLTEVVFEGEPLEVKNSTFPVTAGYYSVQHADAWEAVIDQQGVWKNLKMGPKTVRVVFDANGGEGGQMGSSDYGAVLSAPTVTREGYAFLGWDKDVADIVPSEDVTYTAQWREGYAWDATKSGFYDSAGKEAVIEGEYTLMADFTMPNVTRMDGKIITFTAMKADAEQGTIGLKDWNDETAVLTYATGTDSTLSTGHYSNVRLYNGGSGVNTVTISAFNPAGGAPTVTTFVVDFANGETSGVETIKQDAFFSEYGFSLKALTLGEGVQLEAAYLVLAPRHLQQTDKECFSINFAAWYYNEQSPVTGVAGLYAVEGWNNLTLNENFAVALDMWNGTSTTCVKVAETHAASNVYGWETASDAFLKSYLDDYDHSVKITLEDIPFSQYSVIVYTATEDWNARFKPVQINGVYYAGANTYTHGVGYAVEVSEVDKANGWGASRSHYARFGTNALRVDGLSGDLTIQGGERSTKCRGCIAAIQVINTGDLSDDMLDEVRVGYDALGRTYSLVFRATDSGDWSTVNNWQTFMTGTTADGSKVEEWLDSINSKVPGVPQGNFLDTLLIDGALLSDNITVDEGYKLVEAPVLEGWTQVIGVANGVHLSVEGLLKLQADSDWRVDETSKMTIGSYNTSNPREGTHNILCLAEEGIEFKTNCNVSFNYALGKVGSVRYTNVSGVHTIQQLELDLGDSTKMGFEMKQRKLIGFTSSSATFRAENPTVTTTDANVSAVMTKVPLRVGEYDFEVREDGYYVNYVAYGDNIRPVVQTTINRDANLSELKLTGGEMVVAELTLADGVTLTIDEDPVLAAIRLISAGDVAVTCSLEALTNIGGIVATDVQGDATYEAVGYYYEIPFAKLVGFDKIKKTGSVEWRPNDLSALKDYQLEVANGKMLVNTAMQTVVATAEKPVLVTGEGAILRFEGNQAENRMPNDGYVRAEKGAKIELKGVNPFNHNAPRVVLDEGILKVEATNGCHLKLHSVTMSNGSEIQLSRMATAHVSEGLVLRAQDSATILATAGNNTIKYLDDGTATNVLKLGGELGSGIVDVAQGATLDVQVAVTTSASALTKSGEGTLVWNGTTTSPFVIEAGEIVFNADAQPTNAFSGAGTIVADGATLDLTKATITGCALAVRKNGVLILNQDQVGQMTVPAGSTLKVKVADYEALTLEGVTLAEGENVTFILPNGTEVEGNGNALSKQFAVTASFGLNFVNGESSEDAIVPANGVGVGFFTEKYAAPTYWINWKSSGADQGDFILEDGTLYRVYWTALGSYSSGCGLDTDTKKLLHTYLDDRSHQGGNPGRVKASVTITNLPEDKKYAVALILAGDADNTTAMYNHKYSPVLINGQVYSYDAQANLLTGEAAQSATQWGDRSKAISEEGKLTIGTNVMFVEGLSGGVLSITSAMDEIDVSRLTIAGVQVWITNENVTPAASPVSENAEAISVNFNTEPAGYAVAAEQSAGLYAVDGWNNTLGASGALLTLNISNGESETTLPISLKFSSQNESAWDSATEAYLKGYLDDNGRAPQVEVSNIPFETYSVIVYSATDTAKPRFWPIQVNGIHYVGSSTYNPGVGYAASVESSKADRLPWGGSRNLTAVYGTNAIRVDGLTGETLTIKTANGTSKGTGDIAAIQIVNTGTPVMTEVQEIDWTEFGATSLAVSDLADLITKPIVKLKVAAGATLVVEQPLPVYTIKVVSTGDVAIKVTNLEEISGTMLQQMFDTEYVEGSVTYDYEETFGYTKDDVMYPLIFRGTTDANWETVANWYTGTRKNATETYWMPYTATLAPNLRLSLDWNAMLFDGDLIGDNIDVQSDGYKTITVTTPVEGWTSRIGVMNGVHLKIESLHKLQGGGTWRIDETSKVTVMNKANPGTNDANNRYHVEAEEGLVFVNMPMPGGTAHLGAKGSIKTGSFAAEQSIGEVVLDLGDSSLLGKRTVSRRLYAFTTGTTFNVENCTVKTTVDTITATKVETLQNVGDYWFESKADGYYINYVAYAPKLPESVTGETAEWLQEVLAQAGVTSSEVTLADGVTAEMLEEARLLGVIPEVNGAEVAVATSFTVSDIVVDETTITLAVMIAVEQGELPETVTLGGEVKLMVAQSLADEWTTVVPMSENIEVVRASDPNIQEAVISVTYDRSDYQFFKVIVTP